MSGYTPNKWVDREGTTRYFETIDADGAKIFTPDYTQVTEMGTPVNEDNMNHIEEGIAAGSFSKYDSMTTYEKDDLVTAIIDNELKVYKSLQDNNNGNTLTDTTFWEEVEFAGGGAGLQLFDLIEKDHILTYEESKGLALLGTYVYKEAIAGSRYGYPDFYNRVIDEYNNATEEVIISRSWVQPILTENGTLGGNTFAVSSNVEQYSDNAVYHLLDGVTSTTFHSVSGTKIGYIDFYNPTALRITNLQITNQSEANRASTAGVIYGSNDGLDWKQITTYTNAITASSGVWNIDLSNNESYYKYYRLESTAGGTENYWTIAEIAITATEQLATVKRNSNGHCFYDIANKVDIDNVYDIYGFAWYYGVDTDNERIFLPRGQNYLAQGNNNAISVDIFGNGNALGLTSDLSKEGYAYNNSSSGSGIYPSTSDVSTPAIGSSRSSGSETGSSCWAGITTDPTKSGLVGTVDLSNIGHKAYIYMCVGNTETTSTITDVVDVTTTENDTIPLFTGLYFDFTPNNVSWLKAGQQANSGGIYETAYNELVKALTTSREASTFSTNQVTKNITPTIVGTVNDDPIETEAYYFSENDYLSTTLEVGSDPFELQFEFRTLADVTTAQIVASTEYAEITLAISNGRFYYYSYGEESFAQCLPSTTYTCALGRANGMTYYKVSTDDGDTWTTQENAYPLGDTTVTLNFGKPNGNTEKGANPFKGVIDLTSFVLTSTETQENTPPNIIFDGKVIDVEAMVDGVDYSEYWKVDINAETFTTPTKISSRTYEDIASVVGNGMTLGLTDGTDNYGVTEGNNDNYRTLSNVPNGYGQNVGSVYDKVSGGSKKLLGITTDPTKSGIEAHLVENTKAQLYFKVANAVQNLELLDAGAVMEAVADKISRQDCKAYVTETYQNGSSWYRVYSDGWCEQGGAGGNSSSATAVTITFLKPYASTTYSLTGGALVPQSAKGIWGVGFYDRTPTQFSAALSDDASINLGTFTWEAKGYLA